jgi:PIN domain nuclease of toxin-antitoxin system
MKLLLDSHTFIWWDNDHSKLSPKVLALCQDPANTLLLSVASVWEMQIKAQLGKLTLRLPLGDMVTTQQRANGIEIIPIMLVHTLALDNLPWHHKDPFDRMLIAQANTESAVLLSKDTIFSLYPVTVEW